MTDTVDEFAARVKAKYPQYNNVDNTELVKKVIAKYPQYGAQVVSNAASVPQSMQDNGAPEFNVPKSETLPAEMNDPLNATIAKGIQKTADMPSQLVQKAGTAVVNAITPNEARTQSVLGNMAINAPREALQTGVDIASSTLTPIGIALTMLTPGLSAAAKVKYLKDGEDALVKYSKVLQPVIDLGKKLGDGKLVDVPHIEEVMGPNANMETLQNLKYIQEKGGGPSIEEGSKEAKQIFKAQKNAMTPLREAYTWIKNSNIVRGRNIGDTLDKMVPDALDRQAMRWINTSGDDPSMLIQYLDNPKFADLRPELERAFQIMTNPTSHKNVYEALSLGEQFYKESAGISSELGTIHNIRENYLNQLYEPTPPATFLKTETKSGITNWTGHAGGKVFANDFEAVVNGMKFASTDYVKALRIYSEEMARRNASERVFEYLADNGVAKYFSEGKAPEGWLQVGNIHKFVPVLDGEGNIIKNGAGDAVTTKTSYFAPPGIAKGLSAIADSSTLSKFETLKNFRLYQGITKTINLSWSFFHQFSLTSQALYRGEIQHLLSIGNITELMQKDEFRNLEAYAAGKGHITTSIDYNKDLLTELTKDKKGIIGKITNIPGIKQTLDVSDKLGKNMFDTYQRYLKVMSFGNTMSNWVATHPGASEKEVTTAASQIATHMNTTYGGLNWEAMGLNKDHMLALRTILLAPDWFISNQTMNFRAIKGLIPGTEKTLSVQLARKHLINAFISSQIMTEGLNKIITGHFTDKNRTGHGLEIEMSDDVHFSLLRGGPYDFMRFFSMAKDSGLIKGSSSFLEGKLAPGVRTGVSLLGGVKYTGVPISYKRNKPFQTDLDYLAYAARSSAPVPFATSNLFDYLAHGEHPTILNSLLVGSGLAKYSYKKPPKRK